MRKILIPFASLSLLASCDPRVFDDLADSTWVNSGKKPENLESAGFGVGLAGAGGDSLHYIITAEAPPAVIMAKFDSQGTRSTIVAPIRETLTGANALNSKTALAADKDGFGSDNGNVAVGTFDGTDAALFMLRGENGVATPPFNLFGGAVPSGIVFGETDASAATDLLAVAGEAFNLIADYQAQSIPDSAVSCGLGAVGGAIAIADVDAATSSEVLVGAGGAVHVASASALANAAAAQEECFTTVPPLATIDAPRGEASFGELIRIGDFDGNGESDLVIAAPAEGEVYVYLNWSVATPSDAVAVDVPGGAIDFGVQVETADFDGDGRSELIVADPGHSAQGQREAGNVFVYPSDASGALQSPILLHDARAEENQRFGQSIAVTQAFGGDNLVVGANNEVFTYFRTPVSGDDDFR